MQDDDPMDDVDAEGEEPPAWTPNQFPVPRPVPQTRFTGAIGAIGAIGAAQPVPQTRSAGASKPAQQPRFIGAAPTASFPPRVQRPIPSRPGSRPAVFPPRIQQQQQRIPSRGDW